MKIVTVVGARPQFVKVAVVSRALKEAGLVHEDIIHTGQHFDKNMSDIFFHEMEIPKPTVNLDIHGLAQGAMTGRMLEGLEQELIRLKPDAVLVYGDTNSTLAGALAASKLHIPVAHVEAGLRSFNTAMPEEINRILTDRISTHLYAPTETAVMNLASEGYLDMDCTVFQTGDVMYDAVLHYKPRMVKPDNVGTEDFLLCTIHRQENTDHPERLNSIFKALREIATERPVILPMHPRTRGKVDDELMEGLSIIEPVGYFQMLWLLENSSMVLTDSGGLQKEAYFFNKPCITVRDETEWTELVDGGANVVAGAEREAILEAYHNFASSKQTFREGLYGDGKAGEHIAELIQSI
ncbi:non-hydrolyzing UDP-N-acetylglucosamine 2-epimerase [Limisalsivibrio acetivorans]|uniref:non-hydrolyzing UDP-N-acetylglucosamine 2-epimerase n=1 Tax=Limisalsivibrio acetivorans TaxID=1304888 RepID=UPI0003B35FDF|nr:UDP-N-acetylglucosamine 2-epimerase (non-hydrolyzing) [Limisalsivibrio acetivorans]